MDRWTLVVLLSLGVTPGYAQDTPMCKEDKRDAGSSDIGRWQGNWALPSFEYYATVSGDTVTLITDGDYKDGRLDPIKADCKHKGTFIVCRWASNPSFKNNNMADPSTGTPPFSCYREGIGTLYLLADGKDRRKDVVKGCFIDQASDCAQKNPGTAMSPGANWDMEMPRAEKSSLP